ncbi:MAG: beta-propeller fold lactonase family protein [Gemmatimonadales bacterium]
MRLTLDDTDGPMPAVARPLLPLLLLLAACAKGDKPAATDQPSSMTSQPSGELAYVTNEDSRDLTVIDVATDSVIATIFVGTRPRGVRVSHDGKTVFIALTGSPKCPPTMPDEECDKLKKDPTLDGVAVVDVRTRTLLKTLPAGTDPETFDISLDDRTLFVSNEDAGLLSIVDITTGAVTGSVKVGDEPEGVTVQPDGKIVWVTGESDHNIVGVDIATARPVQDIEVGQRPRSVAFLPDGSKGYVTNEVSGTVTVVDMASHRKIKAIAMGDKARPMGLAVATDGKRVYASLGRGTTIAAIDPATDSIVGTVEVGTRPWGIAISNDGKKLYSANGPSNDVTVVALATMTVIRKITVGSVPWGVAIGPAIR